MTNVLVLLDKVYATFYLRDEGNKMSLCYDFEKWTIISLALVVVSLTVGLVSLAYGQEWNTTEQTQSNQSSSGVLMKYKGNYYCYDSATTEKKEVINAIKKDEIAGATEVFNDMLSDLLKGKDALDFESVTQICKNAVSDGNIADVDYHDEGIVLDGTLTLEIK